ncbi:MAG: hypothetical protein ACJAWV_004479 [Flammeovirgaceae bacterium]|jgi:hypothetical protein
MTISKVGVRIAKKKDLKLMAGMMSQWNMPK